MIERISYQGATRDWNASIAETYVDDEPPPIYLDETINGKHRRSAPYRRNRSAIAVR